MLKLRFVSLSCSLLLLAAGSVAAQQVTLPLWPHGPPDSIVTTGPERDINGAADGLIAGRKIIRLTDVSQPALAVYSPPAGKNSGAAVLVFPGGGYRILAYDLEGTEVCDWLTHIGVTCVLVKYRVPVPGHFPADVIDLEDAQQAMRLTRTHAAEWSIDPHRIGALGFSAGGHLVAVLSNHADYRREGAAIDPVDARPDFVFVLYPGYLAEPPSLKTLISGIDPTANTPPTFLLQAEDDTVHVENALVYFQALKEAKAPAELHIFAQGGHGYGLRPTELPITHWPALAEIWLHTIHVLGNAEERPSSSH
ncbi:MAG TPA: alpha/beta hydrolase [Acidisarcina sp.]